MRNMSKTAKALHEAHMALFWSIYWPAVCLLVVSVLPLFVKF